MGVLTLPGRPPRSASPACGRCRGRRLRATRDLGEVADIYDSFKDPHARAAIRHVVRAVVDWQRPDRHHGRPRLPHRGDADGGGLGPRRHGDPGPARQQRRRPGSQGPRRRHPRLRPLPAQGPPRALRGRSCTTSSATTQPARTPHPVAPAAQGRLDRPGRPLAPVRDITPSPQRSARHLGRARQRPGSVRAHRPRRAEAIRRPPPSCCDPGDGRRVVDAVGRRTPSRPPAARSRRASARACRAWTTTDCASMWKNRRAAGRVSAKPNPSAPSTR